MAWERTTRPAGRPAGRAPERAAGRAARSPARRPPGIPARLRRLATGIAAPHPRFWILTGAIVLLDAAWGRVIGLAVEPEGLLLVAGLVAALLAAAIGLGPVKSEPKLRGMALASAALVAFTTAASVLHYLAAALARPFVDDALAGVEASLGFDWVGHVAALAAHPTLSWWLALAYHSSGPQVAAVVIVLAATGRLGRLWAFVRLFCAALIVVIAVAALWPALGPYAHYRPAAYPGATPMGGTGGTLGVTIETVGALWHLEPVARLREGSLRVLALGDVRGLATFPSFHVCLAALTAWALAPIPVLGPLAFLLNLAVAVATVGAGGHYLPDVLAGALLAGGLLAHRAATRRGVLRTATARAATSRAALAPAGCLADFPPSLPANLPGAAYAPPASRAG